MDKDFKFSSEYMPAIANAADYKLAQDFKKVREYIKVLEERIKILEEKQEGE